MMWHHQKQGGPWTSRDDVVFGDMRHETISVADASHGKTGGTRVLRIEPDILMDFRALPFRDAVFSLVVFDPPHLVRVGTRSWLAAKYGALSDTWQEDLRQGFKECFRVLAPDGTLIFKWNETQVKLSEVLALTPVQPLFGHLSGRKGLTHWLVFMSPRA
jgi:23S rRNA G2069 N7-methylase RlmK/C1962 C5-methylase RlmI